MMRTFYALSIACLFATVANAQPPVHADIEIEVENGVLVTDPRIGEGEFGEDLNPANVADEPGFEADDGVLNAGDVIGFNAVDLLGSNLWFWNGVGPVSFGASPTTLNVEHPVSMMSVTLDSADSGGATGFDVGTADSEGGVHQDLEFVLADMTPDAGVYLFGVEITSPPGTYGTSDPVYMVMASGVDEEAHEAAIGWVETTFGVPEPSSGLMMSAFALALFVLRRQR